MKRPKRKRGKEKIIIFCPNRKRAKRKIAEATNVLIILPIFLFQIFSSYNTAQQKTSHHKQRLPKKDTQSCPHLLVIKHFQVNNNPIFHSFPQHKHFQQIYKHKFTSEENE